MELSEKMVVAAKLVELAKKETRTLDEVFEVISFTGGLVNMEIRIQQQKTGGETLAESLMPRGRKSN